LRDAAQPSLKDDSAAPSQGQLPATWLHSSLFTFHFSLLTTHYSLPPAIPDNGLEFAVSKPQACGANSRAQRRALSQFQKKLKKNQKIVFFFTKVLDILLCLLL
jgi:hypothetical protein